MRKMLLILVPTFVLVVLAAPAHGQGEYKQFLFDEFGSINAEDASARLDNLAIHLQENPSVIGYIVSHGPQGTGPGSGKYTMNTIQEYLVNSRGIESSVLKAIYAGRYKKPEEVFTQLFLIPASLPAPVPKTYSVKLREVSGKFGETLAWEGSGVDECGCGPGIGNSRLAAFGDVLQQQTKDIGYIVLSNLRGAVPGNWRRVGKREAAILQNDGIAADRIKIIFAGTAKPKEDQDAGEVKLQYWILPPDAPPPVKQAASERTPKEAVKLGGYYEFSLREPEEQRSIFEGFADELRANEKLSLCIIVRPDVPEVDEYALPNQPPDVDQAKLVQKWKTELKEKFSIKENRIVIFQAGVGSNEIVEVWLVPPGVALPDPDPPEEKVVEEDVPGTYK